MNHASSSDLGRSLAQLSRPQNVVYPGVLCACIAFLLGASIWVCISCYLLILCMYAVAASVNNYYDQQTDALNQRDDNPLVQNRITNTHLIAFIAANLAIALLLQMFLRQPHSLLLTGAYIILLISYSHPSVSIQSRGLLAPLLLACCYGLIPAWLGMGQAGDINTAHLIEVGILNLLLLIPLLLAKDYKDINGDAATGKRTPLVLYGKRAVQRIATVGALLAVVCIVVISYMYPIKWYASVLLSTVYLFLMYRLHSNLGAMHKVIRLIFSLVLIAITVSFVKHI